MIRKHREPVLFRGFSYRRHTQILALLTISCVVGLVVPPIVSWDGYLYVGSGYSVFHGLMQTQYFWLRELGYPILAYSLIDIGGLRLLIVFQMFLLMASILIFRAVINKVFNLDQMRNGIIIPMMVFSLTWGYGASVLQQIPIVFCFSLLVYGLSKLREEKITSFCLVIPTLVAIQIISSVYFVGAGLATFFTIFLQSKMSFKNLATSVLLCLSLSAPAVSTFVVWEYYKSQQNVTESIYEGPTQFWRVAPYNNFNSADRLLAIPSTFLALNSLGVEFYGNQYHEVGSENRIFGTPQFSIGQECGKFYPGPEDYLAKARMPELKSCGSPFPILEISSFNRIWQHFIPVLTLIGMFTILRFFVAERKKRRHEYMWLCIFPLAIQIPFVFGGAAISRLGLPSTIFFIFFGCVYLLDNKGFKTSTSVQK